MMPMQPTRRPMTNAERQRAWREKHRPRKTPITQFTAPTAAPRPALPPPVSPEQMGPEALFEHFIRKMQPAKKLYLAMLIMDDLNSLCGKRKAKRNQAYVAAALTHATELAQLPEPMLTETPEDIGELEQHEGQRLLPE